LPGTDVVIDIQIDRFKLYAAPQAFDKAVIRPAPVAAGAEQRNYVSQHF
jgi:hypothetical protein